MLLANVRRQPTSSEVLRAANDQNLSNVVHDSVSVHGVIVTASKTCLLNTSLSLSINPMHHLGWTWVKTTPIRSLLAKKLCVSKSEEEIHNIFLPAMYWEIYT